jgi:hypothetical protein
MAIAPHLLTPREWGMEALADAARQLGQPEAVQSLVLAKRYLALADRIEDLQFELDMLRIDMREAAGRQQSFSARLKQLFTGG